MAGGELGDTFDGVLRAAQSGSPVALRQLFDWLSRPVATYLRSGGAEDPDGLANEVFLRAFGRLRSFVGSEARFRSWVFTIAHHLLVDEARGSRRRGRHVPLEEAADAVAGNDSAEEAMERLGTELVRAALAALVPDQRRVLLLRLVADLSLEETAMVLGKSPGAVKSLQHRALASLRRRLPKREAVSP